jgi:hypothetical protein
VYSHSVCFAFFFSLSLEDARLFNFGDSRGRQFDQFFLRGRHIRYIHLPDRLDVMKLMEQTYSRKKTIRKSVLIRAQAEKQQRRALLDEKSKKKLSQPVESRGK